MICKKTTTRGTEAGNALFLILIAVVLFAALSYAITQSNRSSGNANNETNSVSGSTITQYPSAIRTGLTRMMLHGAVVDDLLFDPPATTGAFVSSAANEVFHPSGGGVVYENVDPSTVNAVVPISGASPTSNWYFTKTNSITNIGTVSSDAMAVLADVKSGICQQIDQAITGTTTIPTLGLSLADITTGSGKIITGAGIDGQPFLCVQTSDSKYAYYHVLVEQ